MSFSNILHAVVSGRFSRLGSSSWVSSIAFEYIGKLFR
jgi:hypothetical protein